MMNKRYILLLSFILLTVIFASFILITDNNFDYQPDTLLHQKEPVSIVFSSSWGGYDTKSDEISDLLSSFQTGQSDFEIINNSIGGEDFLLSLKTDFASGNAPDVFGLWPGSDIKQLIEQGRVADLTDILKSDMTWYESFGQDAWDYVTYNDRIYGVPFEIIYEGLFINQSLLATYDLKLPTNYNELKDICQVLKANKIIPIAYNATPEGSFIYQNIIMSLGGKEDVEEPFHADGTIKSCFIDAMYIMKELYDLGAFPDDVFLLSDRQRNDLFIQNKAAMIVQGSWFIGDNAISPNSDNIELVTFPVFPTSKADPSAIIYGCGNGVYHISAHVLEDPYKKEISLNLLKHLTSEETAVRSVNTFGSIVNIDIPTHRIDAPKMYYAGNSLVKNAQELIGPIDSFIDRDIWENIIVKEFPKMLQGKITPEEIFYKVELKHQENSN